MNIEMQSSKVNGAGDLIGTVSVRDDTGQLLFEDVVNLSKARSREGFVKEVAERAHVTMDHAREAIFALIEQRRNVVVAAPADPELDKESKAQQVVRLFLANDPEMFHDERGEPYTALVEDGRRAIYRFGGTQFKTLFAKIVYEATGDVPSSESLRAAINLLSGIAIYDRPEYQLHIRTTWHDGSFFYDLGDWRAVRVHASGWEIVEMPPILFGHVPSSGVRVRHPVDRGLCHCLR